jgi:hypothetical protein
MNQKVVIFKVIDGKVREGGPVNRSSYEAVWKANGWRLSPPKENIDKKENE